MQFPTFSRQTRMRCLGGLLCVVAVVAGSGNRYADSTLSEDMASMAGKLKQLLEGQRQKSIAIGSITGPARARSSSGPALANALREQLVKLGVTVDREAKLEIKGDYTLQMDKQTKTNFAKFTGRVIDSSGASISEISQDIYSDASIAALFGLTVDLPPKDRTDNEREEKLHDAVDKPKCFIEGSRVATRNGSPYVLEILVKKDGQWTPRAAHEDGGQAFVPLKKTEEYAVKLYNYSRYEAAFTLTVDGLNSYAFCASRKADGSPYSRYIVAPGNSVIVKGWQKDLKESWAFLITDYAKSAAAELNNTEGIGTITVSVTAAWMDNQEGPADEREQRFGSVGSPAPGDSATGRGRITEQNVRPVERKYGVLRSAISVRYEK